MATGPEHYRAAEKLLTKAEDNDTNIEGATWRIAAAQAHATLALAAATAMAATIDQEPDTGLPPADANDWYDACGVKTGTTRRG